MRCEGASVGQCHFRVTDIGESLFGGHDDVFAPERSGTHPVPRRGDACDQKPGEPHALCQRFGQGDQRVFGDIGHVSLLLDIVERMVPVEAWRHRPDGEDPRGLYRQLTSPLQGSQLS